MTSTRSPQTRQDGIADLPTFARLKSICSDITNREREAADIIVRFCALGFSERHLAKQIDRSKSWVHYLRIWAEDGYVGTPFGEQSKKARERRKAGQSPDQNKIAHANITRAVHEAEKEGNAEALAEAKRRRLAAGMVTERTETVGGKTFHLVDRVFDYCRESSLAEGWDRLRPNDRGCLTVDELVDFKLYQAARMAAGLGPDLKTAFERIGNPEPWRDVVGMGQGEPLVTPPTSNVVNLDNARPSSGDNASDWHEAQLMAAIAAHWRHMNTTSRARVTAYLLNKTNARAAS